MRLLHQALRVSPRVTIAVDEYCRTIGAFPVSLTKDEETKLGLPAAGLSKEKHLQAVEEPGMDFLRQQTHNMIYTM